MSRLPTRLLPALLLVSVALLSTAALVIVHHLGWRAQVEALSGNVFDPTLVRQGALYAVAWLQWVVLAPILAGAGVVGLGWELLLDRRGR